jgi:hypothetical protein
MPATTRSKSKQTRLDDFADDNEGTTKKPGNSNIRNAKASKSSSKPSQKGDPTEDRETRGEEDSAKTSTLGKRKQPKNVSSSQTPPAKKRQQKEISSSGDTTSASASEDIKPIVINRAPVLQLWGASVAQFLHPNIPWSTCLGIGSQIAALCAISKGRSIGTIEQADPDKKAEKDKKRRKTAESADEELKVMGFAMQVKNSEVVAQGKPKKANEALLKGKFGDGGYEAARSTMAEALKSWKGKETDLNKKAFAMYEHFRPSVQSGQRGWGRKGELKLENIHESVHRH